MLDQEMRHAILALSQKGHSVRAIARTLDIARATVRKVLRSGASVPRFVRKEKADPYRADILDLYKECKGNLVRVHEELVDKHHAALSYQALTAYCRREGIGQEPKQPTGQYHFDPGQEMQHDTSPHQIYIGGKLRSTQTASLVLCYSRMLFFQFYPRFRVVAVDFPTSQAFDRAVIDYFSQKIAKGHQVAQSATGAVYDVNEEYSACSNNCTTQCLSALAAPGDLASDDLTAALSRDGQRDRVRDGQTDPLIGHFWAARSRHSGVAVLGRPK